ncbi:marine proteobacterial sortase target protein [Simiduia aestuariiviva]|uniref:Ca-activated chloride channel family protein n=1 Tax=Simiduia aestuariiviva TaxID=1510459 RepID=A0A839UM00_9GAMM|nr:marine proteobacterial sortase target protein [Simiduia aestuariiviva]MBB3168882.1 Ca-activated chloride channel family protein [Simiduia aestuariiviva]
MCFSPRRIPRHLILEQPKQPNPWLGRWLKLVGALTFLVLGLVIADIARAKAITSNIDIEPLRATSGTLAFKHGTGYVQATHLESEARVTINGMVARMSLTQHFKNDTDQWQEATYTFPLSETSAVNRMEMRIGERTIVARIREREAAKKIYQEARDAGKTAALTEQQRPNIFTQQVANIGPGETVSIVLHVTQPVDYQNGRFHWRLPMTLTPRYIPGPPLRDSNAYGRPAHEEDVRNSTQRHSLPLTLTGLGWALPTAQVPDAPLITPHYHPAPTITDNPMRLHISLNAGLPLARIEASYHDISVVKQGDTHAISTQQSQVAMDRDFELTWQPVASQQPEAALFTEQLNGEYYGLLMVLPQHLQQQPAHLPRDVAFIIDTSGSMDGPSILQAKASLARALSRLRPIDRFNVIEFNSTFSTLFTQPQSAHSHNIQRALHFVQRLHAGGGTEMAPALAAALAAPADESWLKQVVFITDGSVGNEQQLFTLIHNKLGNARLFTVGIGSAPNSFFMRKAAQFGRGTFTHIGSQQEVAEKMDALFVKLQSAQLAQLNIDWPKGMQAEIWPQRLPDVYANEPLLLAVKLSGPQSIPSQITVSGYTAQGQWQRHIPLTLHAAPLVREAAPKGIATVWARAKISALLDEKVRGVDSETIKARVLPLALTHELLSPYTSLVAVDETPRRATDQMLASNAVTNLLPAGQRASSLTYPRTATAAPLWLAAGLLSFCALLLALYWPKRWSRLQRHLSLTTAQLSS